MRLVLKAYLGVLEQSRRSNPTFQKLFFMEEPILAAKRILLKKSNIIQSIFGTLRLY